MTSPLSQVKSDFNDLRQQLVDMLGAKDSFKSVVSAGTGLMLIEFVAGIGAYNQFAIERAVQELSRQDASDPLSILKIASTLGVRILRKRSATVKVLLTKPNNGLGLTVAPYSRLIVDGKYTFVTTQAINFLNNETSKEVTVLEGEPKDFTFTTNNQDYQTFIVGQKFELSNDILRMIIDGAEYTRDTTGIWNYGPNDKVFYENTLPDGSVELMLGSGVTGYKPVSGANVTIRGYVVKGPSINTAATGFKVTVPSQPLLSGTTVSGIYGAEDTKPLDYYRYNSPKIFAAAQRCVRRQDYALLAQYPGVIDIRAVGESDVNPGDIRWMSTVGLVVLTSSEWTSQQKDDFIAWAEEKYTVYGFRHIFIDAKQVLVKPEVELVVSRQYIVSEVVTQVTAAIQSFFDNRRTTGVIGKTFYPGDLAIVIKSVPGVDHFSMTSPVSPVECAYQEYVYLDPSFTVTGDYE